MLIKGMDDRERDLTRLRSLLLCRGVDQAKVKTIEAEIGRMLVGMKGEKDAAYQLDFHFGQDPDWIVLHDMRLVSGNRVAQIDHLVGNRHLEFFVCESKTFHGGIEVNRLGEYSTVKNGQRRAIASPFEQNKRHIEVLKDLFENGTIPVPRRIMAPSRPRFANLILVASWMTIERETLQAPGSSSLVKCDQAASIIRKAAADDKNILQRSKRLDREDLKSVGLHLAYNHSPVEWDWSAKFGVRPAPGAHQGGFEERTHA